MSWIKNGMLVWIMHPIYRRAQPGIVVRHNDAAYQPTVDVKTFVARFDDVPEIAQYFQKDVAPTEEDAMRRMLGAYEADLRGNTAEWVRNHYDWYSKAEQKAKAKTRKQPK